jgi:hypothetical protein
MRLMVLVANPQRAYNRNRLVFGVMSAINRNGAVGVTNSAILV